jgi:hypothetical protein
VLRRVTRKRLSPGAVTAVQIRTAIKQQRRDTPGAAKHCPMQRSRAHAIQPIDYPRLRIQQRANPAETASLSGGVNRMIGSCALGHRTLDFTLVVIRF